MTESFNPYLKWLGIPLDQQPPNPYQLLGIQLRESDPDVIDNAANRQMAHIRSMQSGPHAALSQTLLNELSEARLTLLDPQRKATLDQQLIALQPQPVRMATPLPAATPIRATPIAKQPKRVKPVAAVSTAPREQRPSRAANNQPEPRRKKKNIPLEVAKVVVGGAVGLGIAFMILRFAGINPFGSAEQPDPPPRVTTNSGNDVQPAEEHVEVVDVDERENPFQLVTNGGTTPPPSTDPFKISLPLIPQPAARLQEARTGRVRWAPDYTINDLSSRQVQLTAACRLAQPMLTNPGSLSDTQKKAVSTELIRALQMFAEELTFCTAPAADVESQLTTLEAAVTSISDTPQKVQVLGEIANSVASAEDRARHGVMLVGVVQDMKLVDGLYKTTIRLSSRTERTLAVWSWKDPARGCNVGTTVISFAVLVDAPRENLAGYPESDDLVAWTRHLQSVETSQQSNPR